MHLQLLDWVFIILYALITVFIGLKYSSRAGENLTEFFLSGRQLPWYVAGFSMVATTFAADTPLAVTELVNKNGISGNWLWWNMLIGGMLTTFFFARMWRRAEIFTDNELIELRYGGKPAAFLRGFKGIYLGLFINAIVIGWVNLALVSILQVFFDIPHNEALYYTALAMLITAIYSSVSGLWGVAITDLVQFVIAMTGCIILSIIVVHKAGGIEHLKTALPEGTLRFLPSLEGAGGIAGTLTITLSSFFAYIGVQWWASWYPGAEPGGGGYIAQRMMSTKNEKHSLMATLFFQVMHYCVRPWPWILVGLSVIILYPDPTGVSAQALQEFRLHKFVFAMRDYLPVGLRGLLLVAFLAAYMSTISTQLNWGASYLVNDVFKRFIRKEDSFPTEKKAQKFYVLVSRITTIFLMAISLYATTQMDSISGVWAFVIECGAGLGLVLLLRWYWWRINAWSEIAATITPFIVFGGIRLLEYILLKPLHLHYGETIPDNILNVFYEQYPFLVSPNSFFIIVGCTSFVWLSITFLTRPELDEVLQKFYKKITPEGYWEPVRISLDMPKTPRILPWLFLAWGSSIVMTYSLLFFMGEIIFHEWKSAALLALCGIVGLIGVRMGMKHSS